MIQTTLNEKPCRVVSYVLPSYSHPGFICRNIPYSLAYRLVRIESTKEGLEHNLIKLQQKLVSRGYRAASVKAAIDTAKLLARNQILEKVQKKANQRPVFCVPYDPKLLGITVILLSRDVDAREYYP